MLFLAVPWLHSPQKSSSAEQLLNQLKSEEVVSLKSLASGACIYSDFDLEVPKLLQGLALRKIYS